MKKIYVIALILFLAQPLTGVAQTGRSQNSENAEDTRVEGLQEQGSRLIASRVELLDRLRVQVGKSDGLTEEEKSALYDKIADKEVELNNLTSDISSETDLTTLRNLIRSIGRISIHTQTLPTVRVRALLGKLGAVLNRMEAIERRVSALLARAEGAGLDTANAEEAFGDYQGYLDEASELIGEIKDLIAEFGEEGHSTRTNFNNIKNKIKLAHSLLRQARKALNDTFSELRNLKQENDEQETTENENEGNAEDS